MIKKAGMIATALLAFALAVMVFTLVFASDKGSKKQAAANEASAKTSSGTESGKEAVSEAMSEEETGTESVAETESEKNGETEPEKNGETEPPEKNGETEPPKGNGEESIPGVPKMPDNEAMEQMCNQFILPRVRAGETWAVCLEDLEEGTVLQFNEEAEVLSASVIKVFIMATVYDRVCYPKDEASRVTYNESYDGELRSLLNAMITVSDNDAANSCIAICGGGDFEKGKEAINAFCEENGYTGVHVGRRFLDSNPTDDNYITAKACRMILSDIYHGRCVNEEASAKMLEILKGQQLRNKIPSGLPQGFTSANKTGEMPLGYNLGCIENDIAIVFSPEKDYVLVALSSDLEGKNDEAISLIGQISSYAAAHLEELFPE